MNEENILDIYSTEPYPSDALSNFYPHAFEIDGVSCASMEGFLQSLKTKNTALQEKVCGLAKKEAKFFFSRKIQNLRWKLTGNLYWKGKAVKRTSDEYQLLLDRAYDALYTNPAFVKALIDSDGKRLTHKCGKHDTGKTVLTEYEFISRLLKLRARALGEGSAHE